jgi:hypothetical protein
MYPSYVSYSGSILKSVYERLKPSFWYICLMCDVVQSDLVNKRNK